MDAPATDLSVVPVTDAAFALVPHEWRFATERRTEIDRYFEARRRVLPDMWNGRVLLLCRHEVAGGVLVGDFFQTDFASFLAWRDWGFPDPAVTNCFAMGALRAGDGAFLLGEMAAGTANAGRIYFPSGTPDPSDVRGDRVDLAGSLVRELAEETGMRAGDYAVGEGWLAVPAGSRLAMMRILQATEPAAELGRRIVSHLVREQNPELAGIRIVRGPADLDPAMPDFVRAFLRYMWARESH